MKSSRGIFIGTAGYRLLASCALLVLAVSTTYAQQITGTPGSPSATTTIDGKYLPPPPSKRLSPNPIGRRKWSRLRARPTSFSS